MKHLQLLGNKVTDTITGYTGVVVSVSYDITGCIQALIRPQVMDTGEMKYPESAWIDVQRLKIHSRVVGPPAAVSAKTGAVNKPAK